MVCTHASVGQTVWGYFGIHRQQIDETFAQAKSNLSVVE
jgi:hypothetical protein